jgi:hypothetical protein
MWPGKLEFQILKSQKGNQVTRIPGCRISENQDIRNSENERILNPDALIS